MKKLAGGVLFIVVLLGCLEIAVRTWVLLSPNNFLADFLNNQPFRGRPFSKWHDFHLNSMGFMDTEFSETTPLGTFRILAIGDSFVFGVVPYADNFVTLLEESMNHLQPTEIFNLGIPHAGPKNYSMIASMFVPRYRPDLVLVHLFMGNDLTDSLRKRPRWLSWALLDAVYKILTKTQGRVFHPDDRYDDSAPRFTEEFYQKLEARRGRVLARGRAEFDSLAAQVVPELEKIKETCEANRSRLLVVLVPDEIQVNDSLKRAAMPNTTRVDLPNRWIVDSLNRRNIPVIDLLAEFRERTKVENLYKPRDTHLNIAGNRFAAELLFKLLKEHIHSEVAAFPGGRRTENGRYVD
jgi:SGNH hydrolase-like domain, acetyltransferase AlgX